MDPRKYPELLVGPYPGYYPQKYLFDYLSIKELDPFDAPAHMIEEWAEEKGIDMSKRDPYAHDLNSEELADFEKWLKDNEKGIAYVERDPYYAPAYLTLKWPKLMPRGRWALHFTRQGPFEAFNQGATMQNLALSTWTKEKKKAKCPDNLTDNLGQFDYVYIFAVDQKNFGQWASYARKYGPNAILFQTDAGVEAYHIGDEEDQLLVPVCSEYNVIPIWDIRDGIRCRYKNSEDEGLEFDSPKELLAYIEKEEARGARPLERILCT